MSGDNIQQDLVDQLCAIANVSKTVASNLLEACGNNLEMAVNMHMEGVITDPNQSASIAHSSGSCESDNVRAPIPQRQEILVDSSELSFSFRGRSKMPPRSVFDKFRDFEAETRRQEEAFLKDENPVKSTSRKHKLRTLEDLFRPPLDIMFRGTFQAARDKGVSRKKWLLVNIQNASEFPCQVLNRDVWSNAAVKTILNEHFIFWQIYHDSEEGVRYTNFYKASTWPNVSVIDPRTGELLVTWSKLDPITFCDLVTEFIASVPSLNDSASSDSPMNISSDSDKLSSKKSEREKGEGKGIHSKGKESTGKGHINQETPETSDASHNSLGVMSETKNIYEADEESQIEAAIKASLQQAMASSALENGCSGASSGSDHSDLETFDSENESIDYSLNKNRRKAEPTGNTDSNDSTGSSFMRTKKRLRKEPTDVEENHTRKESNHSEIEQQTESISTEFDNEIEWKKYLGKSSDKETKLMLRFPDGTRDIVQMPSSSKLMALVLYVGSKGYSNECYEMVTTFPKKQISQLDFHSTLISVGLFPQETVFIQKR